MEQTKKRVYLLDIFRGIAVLGMVFHHALVSAEIVFFTEFEFLKTTLFGALQLIFVSVFLLVSGICTNYSRNVLKRGSIVFAAALLVSFATCIVLPAYGIEGLNIYFGILHMFGLSMIIYALCKKVLDTIPTGVGVVVFTVLFIGYYVFYSTEPTSNSLILMLFGVLPNSITSYGDYYPLLPYFFLFVAGTYCGKLVADNKMPKWFYTARFKPLEFCGKYSLWVYILHQPIIFGTFLLISILKNR